MSSSNPDLSEASIRSNCPFCDPTSHAYAYMLAETNGFRILCDRNPLAKGHILVIPKTHRACIAEYSQAELGEFESINAKVAAFVKEAYGSVAIFEHGNFGQTVFHSHVHYLPYTGDVAAVVPEGSEYITAIGGLSDLDAHFRADGGYLYAQVAGQDYVVDAKLAAPRFFRDRFAVALGAPERGNWKLLQTDPAKSAELAADCEDLVAKWRANSPV